VTAQRHGGTIGPYALRVVWHFWKAYAEKIGHYQTAAILSFVYALIVGPIWLVGRLTGHRFIPTFPARAPSFWYKASMGHASLDEMAKQG
jgi:Saxitoxin biosynthesis operon protein SxtJ